MQIDSTNTHGHSKNSLSEAIANAVGDALGVLRGDADSQVSLTVIVEGYQFDGTEYQVNVRVMILDYAKNQHEFYEHLKNDNNAPDLANDMTAASYGKRAFDASNDQYANEMQEYLDDTYLGFNDDKISAFVIMAAPATHDHLEMEAGYFERREAHPKPEQQYDGPEPSFGGMGSSSAGSSNKDAA